MATSAKLSITLPAKRAAAVRKAVKSGAFSSDSEAIAEAIRVWEDQLEYLRKAWKEGIESGPSKPWDLAEIKATARRRFEAAKRKRKNG